MANNRDVKLTIKARDEASKVISQIKDALEKYSDGSAKASKNSGNLGGKIKALGQEVSSLQGQIVRAKGQMSLDATYRAISSSLSKVSEDYKKNSAVIRENSLELSAAKRKADILSNARSTLSKTLSDERKALKDATSDMDRNTASLSKAEANVLKYRGQIEKTEETLSKYQQDLDRATAAQRRAREEDERAARTSDVLRASISELRREREAARRTAVPTVSKKAGVTVEMRDTAISAKAGNIARLDAEIARLESLQAIADKTRAASQTALQAQNATVRQIEAQIKTTNTLEGSMARLLKAEKQVAESSAGITKAGAAIGKLSAQVNTGEIALQEFDAELKTTGQRVSELESESKRLAGAMKTGEAAIISAEDALQQLNNEASRQGIGGMLGQVNGTEKALLRLEQRLEAISALQARAAKYSDGAGGYARADDAAKLRKLNAELTASKEDAAAFRAEIERIKKSLAGVNMSKKTRQEIDNLKKSITFAEADARDLQREIKEIGIASGTMQRGVLDSWRKHNNESRTALSLYQRIRGQVLSMIGAYVGLFGAVSAVQGVTQAYMQQEAALSRLGVVFDGNVERMGVEMDWLRREAKRLGIELGTIADEYTKFAVAGSTSGFSDESIRRIFTSISEAARVNKLSLEDIKGVYLALSQMISKGKVSAEELRQQLGERLPGAVKLMADALGVSVAQLDDMMKKGEALASEENMLKFAEVLTDRFGKQLPAALDTFTTEWGRLQNTIFNAKLTTARGGVIGALTEVMRLLNDFANSEEGTDFFLGLGAAIGDVIKWVPTLVENFETLIKVIKLLIVIPIAKWVGGMAMGFLGFLGTLVGSTGAIAGSRAAIIAWGASITAATGMAAKARIAIAGLRVAFATLGPIALGIVAAGAVFEVMSDWESGVDDIVSAQEHHKRVMDEILAKYDEAKTKTYDWKDAIDEKNRVELAKQLPKDIAAFDAAIERLRAISMGEDQLTGSWAKDLWKSTFGNLESNADAITLARDISEQFGISPELVSKVQEQWQSIAYDLNAVTKEQLLEFKENLLAFAEAVPDVEMKSKLISIADDIDTAVNTGNNLSLIVGVLRELGHAVDDPTNAVGRFKTSMEDAAGGVKEAEKTLADFEEEVRTKYIKVLEDALTEVGAFADGFTEEDLEKTMTDPFSGATVKIGEMLTALNTLKGNVPLLAQALMELGNDKVIGSLDRLLEKLSWMKDIPGLSGLLDKLFTGGMGAATGGVGGDGGNLLATAKKFEGMNEVSNKDVLMDFFKQANTNIDPEMVAWCAAFVNSVLGANGLKGTGSNLARSFLDWGEEAKEPQVGDIVVLKRGSDPEKGHVGFFQGFDGNGGVIVFGGNQSDGVKSSTYSEADILGFRRAPTVAGQTREEWEDLNAQDKKQSEEDARAKEKAAEDAVKAAEAKSEELADVQTQLGIEQMRVDGKEREAFIQEKINAFVKQHGALSAEEEASLREQYGTMYDLQNMKSKDVQLQEEIKKHQEEINRLETERNALLEQRKVYEEEGNTEKVDEINERLTDVNAQLETAIQKFIDFWKASNSPDAAAGIAQLEATKLGLKEVGKEALLTAQDINERFADGFSNAFSALAEAIGKGGSALKSLRNAFLQFASDFLIEIGKMIIKQTMLNMLQNMGGGGGGLGGMILGGLKSITTGIFHTGKGPGARGNGMTRNVSPALFAGAPRFHSGKLPGLRSGEMAAIIEEDEEVLPTSDARHAWNLNRKPASEGGGGADTTIVNAFDTESFLQQGLATPNGRRVMMNFVRANKSAVKRALE